MNVKIIKKKLGRPYMLYFTFGLQALQNLNQVIKRFGLQEMNVGELWNKLVEYSAERFSAEEQGLASFSCLTSSLSATN
ncbi:hypothetical protein Bca4012_033582 [Brassica carinata]